MSEYIVNWSSNTKGAISLPEQTLNSSSTSLVLTGRGLENYGEIQQENFIRLLENFAKSSAPDNPTIGQLWYQMDTTSARGQLKILSYVQDSTPVWENVFPIPYANSTTYGLVKVGNNLNINSEGKLDYTLPIASDIVLGGVKIAANATDYGLKITSGQNGGLLEYILPTASPTVLGGVKIAANSTAYGLKVTSSGFIEYNLPPAGVGDSTADAALTQLGAVRIKQGGGLALDSNGFLSSTVQGITPATADNIGGVKVGPGLSIDGSSSVLSVKVGSGLSLASDGTLSATGGAAGTVSSVGVTSTDLDVSNSPVTSSGNISLALKTVSLAKGGTGVSATTKAQALSALLPDQNTSTNDAYLRSDGSSAWWSVLKHKADSSFDWGYATFPGGNVVLYWGKVTFTGDIPNMVTGSQLTVTLPVGLFSQVLSVSGTVVCASRQDAFMAVKSFNTSQIEIVISENDGVFNEATREVHFQIIGIGTTTFSG